MIARHTAVVIRGSEPVTKLRRKCSSGQTKKTWYSQTGIHLNQTTPMAMKIVSLCRDGQWHDNNCNKTFNIICERYVFG